VSPGPPLRLLLGEESVAAVPAVPARLLEEITLAALALAQIQALLPEARLQDAAVAAEERASVEPALTAKLAPLDTAVAAQRAA